MDTRIQNTRIADLLGGQTATRPASQPAAGGVGFNEILQDQLKVSGHARTRLESRSIQLGQKEWERVLRGVDKAAQKGAKDSLVMLDDIALVVSVKNRTVITAVDRQNLTDNVFTNIDSAVIV